MRGNLDAMIAGFLKLYSKLVEAKMYDELQDKDVLEAVDVVAHMRRNKRQ